MSQREVRLSLQQMLDAASEAVALGEGRTAADPRLERVLDLAVARVLEVMGEAANRVPRDEQAEYPYIPWAQVVGLRNRLIHGYDSVDYDILWTIVDDDLPHLIVALEQALDTH